MNELIKYKIIFWDFDGVIKDSVFLKGDAFVELFKNHKLIKIFQKEVYEKSRAEIFLENVKEKGKKASCHHPACLRNHWSSMSKGMPSYMSWMPNKPMKNLRKASWKQRQSLCLTNT